MKEQHIDQLLLDETFLNFYFKKNEQDVLDWEEYIELNPEKETEINEAFTLLNTLSLKWNESQVRNKYRVFRATQSQNSSPLTLYRTWWAAALLVCSLGGLWLWQSQQSSFYQTVVAPKKLIEKINQSTNPLLVLLPDGSSVLIEKNARLSYPQAFEATKREVFLEGEAFFEVAKNPASPFLIYANQTLTKVVGTSFTVKADANQKEVHVLVKTGKVSVYPFINQKIVEDKGVLITPNQQVTYQLEAKSFEKTLIPQPELVNKPQVHTFIFKDVAASDVFSEIQKAYGISIVYDAETFKDCPITASLNDEPLRDKIALICAAIEAKYEFLDGQIIITGKGCK